MLIENLDIENSEKNKITISYNPDEEMMAIRRNGKTVFYGNYWDFKKDPDSIKDFLYDLGLDVEIDDKLESIG